MVDTLLRLWRNWMRLRVIPKHHFTSLNSSNYLMMSGMTINLRSRRCAIKLAGWCHWKSKSASNVNPFRDHNILHSRPVKWRHHLKCCSYSRRAYTLCFHLLNSSPTVPLCCLHSFSFFFILNIHIIVRFAYYHYCELTSFSNFFISSLFFHAMKVSVSKYCRLFIFFFFFFIVQRLSLFLLLI